MSLEQVVLSRGPVTLIDLISQAGGRGEAARLCGVAPLNLFRWVQVDPSRSLGTGQWAGYPKPLPFLDVIVEHHYGAGWSYVSALASRLGFLGAMGDMRVHGISLVRIGLGQSSGSCLGQASWRMRRLRSGVPYPHSWKALDHLARHGGKSGWLEAVLDPAVNTRARPVSAGAFVAFVQDTVNL